jgi:hypothetical protein
VDPGLHGPQRDAGELGDLGVVIALDVEQDDGGPLVGRDPRQGRVEHPGSLALHRGVDRVGVGARRRLPALVFELRVGLRGPPLAQPLLVHRGVDRDPAQPRADAAAAERPQVAVRGEERLLHGIGGLVPVRDHARDERVQVVLIALHESVEGVEAAVAGLLQQDQVTALRRVVDDLRRAGVLHVGRDPPGGGGEARRV